jgi:hypothetical protein
MLKKVKAKTARAGGGTFAIAAPRFFCAPVQNSLICK